MFDLNQWVYYLAIILCGFAALFMRANQVEYSLVDATSGAKRKRATAVYVVTFVLVGYIVFWAAIRNGIVDTFTYIKRFNALSTEISFDALFKNDEEKAPLWKLYQIILKRLGLNWHFFLGSVAIVTGIFIYKGISEFSDDVPFSFYLFMTGLYFYWMFNGIRQFLVAAIVFASLRLITEKKLIKFLVLIATLYFLHKMVLIMIPIYFIANMKNWSYGIYTCVLATMAVVILFPGQFTALLDDSFEEYNVAEQFAKDDGVNIFRFLVAMVTPTLAFIYKKQIAEYDNKYINVMVNMSLITAGIYSIGVVTSGIYIGRLPLFTDMFGIILLPFIIKRVLPKNVRGPIWVASLIFYFVYFYLQLEEGMYYTTDWFRALDVSGLTV